MIRIEYDPAHRSRRWVAYFDLLGTRERIESENHFQVFDVFSRAVEAAEAGTTNSPTISYACFSDSFIMYSSSDSGPDFTHIEQVARLFAYKLIIGQIPVRGALSCGDFYADAAHSLYFGPALIEAYRYGEAQEWLGLVLAPSAVLQMDKVGLPAGKRLNYAYWKIPFKKESDIDPTNELPACVLGRWIIMNGHNPCLSALTEMKNRAVAQSDAEKYAKAIEFIESHHRISPEEQLL